MKNTLRFLILHFAFIILNLSFTSAQEIEWQKTIGGSTHDLLYSVYATSDGGCVIGGKSSSPVSGDKTEGLYGYWDYWILKLDSVGNIQWQNVIGGANEDILNDIKETSDGGFILGGYSNSDSIADKTENCIGSYDYWVLKLDSNGNIVWQNTIGGSGQDILECIFQTSDNGYILGGYSTSNISGDKTQIAFGQEDYWVVKIDSVGNVVWDKTYGTISNEFLRTLKQTNDGGYLLGGTTWNVAWNEYYLIKIDSIGNQQWQGQLGGAYNDYLESIALTFDGGFILCGYSNSDISVSKSENTIGILDYWILKFGPSGNIEWDNTIGGPRASQANSIIQTLDGNYVVAGYSDSNIGVDKSENCQLGISKYDYWVVKLDTNGNIIWQNTIGGSQDDRLISISESKSGRLYLGGYSDSNISFDKLQNSRGSIDYWVVKLTSTFNSITGISYADLNSSNTKDANEPALTQQKITEQTTGRFTFTDQNGNYSVSVLDSGNFTVAPPPTGINYYNAVPSTHPATFTGINQTDSLNDFALQPTGVFNDLCITITPTGPFRSGFNASYVINYQNVGTTSIAGDVIFFPYSNVTYVSSNVTPTSVSLDSVIWNTGVLAPFQGGSIVVTVAVNVGLPIGTLINSAVRIEPVANDSNPGCNYHSWEVYTIGSYDPNDILVSEDTILTTQLVSAPWLDYTIRFQNTGNDTAFAVKIINPIDTTLLELSTIEFVNSSHPVNLNYIPWERNMQFTFNNILLPDSNINEPLSHGFVHYRIKPKTTLQSGDSILNNAFIYFDFNAPVATNTVATHIVLPTAINHVATGSKQLLVFPNPAANEITISGYPLAQGASTILKIIDVMGKEVYSASVTTLNFKLQTLNFPPGVYFVQVGGGNSNIARAKFIKQ